MRRFRFPLPSSDKRVSSANAVLRCDLRFIAVRHKWQAMIGAKPKNEEQAELGEESIREHSLPPAPFKQRLEAARRRRAGNAGYMGGCPIGRSRQEGNLGAARRITARQPAASRCGAGRAPGHCGDGRSRPASASPRSNRHLRHVQDHRSVLSACRAATINARATVAGGSLRCAAKSDSAACSSIVRATSTRRVRIVRGGGNWSVPDSLMDLVLHIAAELVKPPTDVLLIAFPLTC